MLNEKEVEILYKKIICKRFFSLGQLKEELYYYGLIGALKIHKIKTQICKENTVIKGEQK